MWYNLIVMFITSAVIAFVVAGIIELVFHTIGWIDRRKQKTIS